MPYFGLHRPVRLYILADNRTMTIRKLQAAKTFEAKLPLGPTNKFEYDRETDAKMDKHELYATFLDRMEQEVASLLCLETDKGKTDWRRSAGPKFVVRNAIKDNEVWG